MAAGSKGWALNGAMAGLVALCAAAPLERCAAQDSASDSVEAAFKGKSINFIVALAAGGGYDQYARTLARHLERHLDRRRRRREQKNHVFLVLFEAYEKSRAGYSPKSKALKENSIN